MSVGAFGRLVTSSSNAVADESVAWNICGAVAKCANFGGTAVANDAIVALGGRKVLGVSELCENQAAYLRFILGQAGYSWTELPTSLSPNPVCGPGQTNGWLGIGVYFKATKTSSFTDFYYVYHVDDSNHNGFACGAWKNHWACATHMSKNRPTAAVQTIEFRQGLLNRSGTYAIGIGDFNVKEGDPWQASFTGFQEGDANFDHFTYDTKDAGGASEKIDFAFYEHGSLTSNGNGTVGSTSRSDHKWLRTSWK